MNNFETLNRLRLHSMLAEHGLGKPLNDYEMALQLSAQSCASQGPRKP